MIGTRQAELVRQNVELNMDKLEPWEEVIINSTNHIFAKRMIKKVKDYRAKYKGIDVDSIAKEFASGCEENKKEWALMYNNMASIVKICRVQRRIASEAESDRASKERQEELRIEKERGYGKNYKERYGDWYD